MSTKKLFIASAVCVMVASGPSTSALADELTVLDCDGFPRATSQVEENSMNTVQVAFNKASEENSVEFVLTNSQKGDEISRLGEDEAVNFSNVPAGSWKLCFDSEKANVSKVSIVKARAIGDINKATVISGVGIATGGTLLGIMAGRDSGGSSGVTAGDTTELAFNSDRDLEEPSIENTSSKTKNPEAARKPGGGAGTTAVDDETCDELEEEEPDVISTFE